MARKGWRWEDCLAHVLSTKPAEVVQEACQVLVKHGCHVKKLKSELYYSSALGPSCVALYANFIVAHAWEYLLFHDVIEAHGYGMRF